MEKAFGAVLTICFVAVILLTLFITTASTYDTVIRSCEVQGSFYFGNRMIKCEIIELKNPNAQ